MRSTAVLKWDELLTTAQAWQCWLNELPYAALRERCLSWLSKEEYARFDDLRATKQRHEFLASRALCRLTLSRYAAVSPSSWIFGTTCYGKPIILEPAKYKRLRFNVTHTAGLAICIVSRAGDVGIDAEETSRDVDVERTAAHFISAREQLRLAKLSSSDRSARFFELWVLKEALIKGLGRGLPNAPERLTIALDANGDPMAFRNWQFSLHWASSHHVAAAAIRRPRAVPDVSIQWLKADDLLETSVAVEG